MGSSKKKHKKNKDKDKEREKSKSKSSSHGSSRNSSNASYNSIINNDTPLYLVEQPQHNPWDDKQQSTGQQSTMLKPLRLVLKVPPSYSQTNAVPKIITTTNTSTVSEPISVQSYNDHHQSVLTTSTPSYLDPIKSTLSIDQNIATSADISSKMISTNVFNSNVQTNMSTSNEGGVVNSLESSVNSLHYVNSLFSVSSNKLLSKKVKKSKKSKKSKHRKHSHSHKHSHKKHHHHILPSVLSGDTTTPLTHIYDLKSQVENKPSTTELSNSLPFQSTIDHKIATANYDTPSTLKSTKDLFGNNNNAATQPATNHNFSTQHFQDLELKPSNESESKLNWHFTNTKTTFASTNTTSSSEDPVTQQSYYLSSSSNASMSQKTGPEIKLTLSKASSSTQYSSNLKHSPSKSTSLNVTPQIVPPLIISPSKTSSPFVGKASQPINAVVPPNLNLQNNSKTSSVITSNTSTAVSEPKMLNLKEPLIKSFKLSNDHKKIKKSKSEKNFQDLLFYLLRQLTKKDSQGFFAKPVSDLIAPGYSSIIAHPMDLSTIGKNITSGHYRNLGDFKADVKLMCDNAMKYNRVETIYYKSANKLWHYTKNKLFKNSSLAEFSKTYVKCTPMDLSLNPTNPPSNSKHLSNTTSFFNITPFNAESTSLSTSTTFTGTNLLKSSPKSTEATNSLPVGFGGIVPMTSSTPFKLDPEPSSAVTAEVTPTPTQNQTQLPEQTLPVPVKKNIVCDGLTAEELVASIKESARKASEKLLNSRKRPPAYSVLKQDATTGTVMLHTLNTGDIAASSKQTFITNTSSSLNDKTDNSVGSWLSDFTKTENKTKEGETKTTNQFETNNNYTASQTFANNLMSLNMMPADSSSDLLAKKEAEIERLKKKLIATYGDEVSLDYALSVAKFANGCEYSENLFNTLMGVLSGNQHRNVFDQFYQLVKLTTEN